MRVDLDVQDILSNLKRLRLVFINVGYLFAVDALPAATLAGAERHGLRAAQKDATELNDSAAIDTGEIDLLVITGIAALNASPTDRCMKLGQLREVVMALLESNMQVLLVSDKPASSFRGCPGSSVILDAKRSHLSPVSLPEIEAACQELGVGQWAKLIWAYSNGLPLLVERFIDLLVSGHKASENELKDRARALLISEASAAIAASGPSLASWLDSVLFELKVRRVDAQPADPSVVEACRDSGFAQSDDEWATLELFPGPTHGLWKESVRSYVDSTLALPEEHDRVIAGLWRIERRIRSLILDAAVNSKGKGWKSEIFDSKVKARILERAREEAFPTGTDMADIPNPIEWLSFGELMDVLSQRDWARPPNVDVVFWRRLATELGPIRNRVAHVRLLQLGDDRVVDKWESRMAAAFGM
jgi:hypothetical protein